MAAPPLRAATHEGDVLLLQATKAEDKGTTESMDQALGLAIKALQTDPADIEYSLVESRIRVFDAQRHVHEGNLLLDKLSFDDALREYQKAAFIDPSSAIAKESIRRTQSIIARRKTDPSLDPATLLLMPIEKARRDAEQLFSTVKPPARLDVQLTRPLPQFRVNQQGSGEIFALLGKLANVRVLFDPDYLSQNLGKNQLLDFRGLTLQEALDYVALITKSFWKPLLRDTILVSNDDPAKRNMFDDQVTKVLYLTNASTPQEVQRIGETVKTATDMKRLLIYPEQSALVLRGDPSRVTLAEKLVDDLDKPKAEIVVDVIVLSVSKDWVRDLGVVFGITSSNMNVTFAPRASVGGVTSASGPSTIPLSSLQHLSAGDFGITLPGAALNALLTNQSTKIVDKAQLRTMEGQKSTLRIGQKVPYATGSFAPGAVGSAGPLVNTQFSFFDVGLNLDVTAKVNGPDEVSLHIESDHSSVADYQNIGGGLQQPVITQRKRVADVRVKEGEVNFWDIVTSRQSQKTISGVPGLMNIPYLGRFLTSVHREETETLLLHLLIPHIIRPQNIDSANLAGVNSGNEQVVKLAYTQPTEGPGAALRSAPTDEVVDVVKTQPPEPAPAAPAAAPAAGAAPATAPAPPAAAPPAGASLAFTPSTVTAAAASKFTVEIAVNNAPDLAAAALTLGFDPAVLNFVEASPGAFLSRDGAPATATSSVQNNQLSVWLVRPGTGAGANGSGALVSLTFEAKQAGVAPISLTGALKNSQDGDISSTPVNLEVTVR
jgi:general secretion pathway protein D